MAIAEPTTTLTDYALTVCGCFWGGRLLALGQRERQTSARLCAASLLATALAALAGGTSHGFAPHLGPIARVALWLLTYDAIGLANLCLLAGAAFASTTGALRRLLLAAISLRFFVYASYLASHREFRYVVYDFAVTSAALLVFALHARAVRHAPEAGWVFAALAVSCAGVLVQRSGIALHADFNHNDLFHVIQTAGLYLFYRGGRLLRDCAS